MNDPTLIWFLIGIGLLLLEFTAPGLVIFFFGLGGLITSLAHRFLKSWFLGNSENEKDEMRTEFIGKSVKVTMDIPEGAGLGKVELKGADWNAKSKHTHAKGDMVTVTERDGLTLTVE